MVRQDKDTQSKADARVRPNIFYCTFAAQTQFVLMERIAVFPGSFDPFTLGHESIVLRGLKLFDRVIVGVGSNDSKQPFFSPEARVAMIRDLFQDEPRIDVQYYTDLTIDFCRRNKAQYMLRGLRTTSDFEYERVVAQVNQAMLPEVESVFMLTFPEHTAINSTVVREVLRYGGDVSKFLPARLNIQRYMPR